MKLSRKARQEDVMWYSLCVGMLTAAIGISSLSLKQPYWLGHIGFWAWMICALCVGSFLTALALPDPFTRKRRKIRKLRRKQARQKSRADTP